MIFGKDGMNVDLDNKYDFLLMVVLGVSVGG
ncbi:predicted protein [Sclerotinia sclerotiorum 1980 UF-70]|uniref:Uncharacterized protein n=1 Tax=Sclerotinia sclerotiorum (strain ATCC 18683 / 1980 / Ss-1) TaxID=665079 RepID=A7F756_SCLS1|nr:predicted protein [Sclerotinia sclerotiorum 1980 UF-70]EDN98577.1 predicted protein [Sclerotinia sclerotiorum 1980 UF-70]